MTNKLIVIEGLDGSGKSTLSSSLFKRIATTFLSEQEVLESAIAAIKKILPIPSA